MYFYLYLLLHYTSATCGASCSICDGNKCASCTQEFSLQSGNGCICLNGYFDSDSSDAILNCQPCNADCFSCYGSGSSKCITCADSSLVAYKGSCYYSFCPSGTYEDSGRVCTNCNAACESCTDSGADKCLECNNGYIQEGVNCLSLNCPTGEYLSPQDGNCYSCTEYCSVCDISSLCNQCDSTFVLGDDKKCRCSYEGYSIQSGFCKEICGDGINKGQVECDDGNIIDGDGCNINCEIEIGWECEGESPDNCTETAVYYGLRASLNVLSNNTIEIMFNNTLKNEFVNQFLQIYVAENEISFDLIKKNAKLYLVKLDLKFSVETREEAIFKFDRNKVRAANSLGLENHTITVELNREEI